MNNRTITIEHEGKTYGGQPAVIKSTGLGYQHHGIFTASFTCEWPGGGISPGGYCLDSKPTEPGGKREGSAYGLDHIIQILRVVGVERWEDLPGSHVVVLFEGRSLLGRMSVGIANAISDDVLIFEDHAQAWLAREPESVVTA